MATRLLRRPEVLKLTGWSTSTLYEKMEQNRFPRPVKPDPDGRAVAWLESEIEEHQQAIIAHRDSKAEA